MGRMLLARSILALCTLTFVSMLVFVAINAMPGNAATASLTDSAAGPASPEDLKELEEELGLNRPLPVQYLDWLGNALTGDLGWSYSSHDSVANMIKKSMPTTLEIAALAILIGSSLGIVFGIVAAVYRDSWIDQLVRFVAVAFLSVPSFFIGTLFILYASIWFDYALPVPFKGPLDNFGEHMQFIVIATATLGLRLSASIARLVRTSMLDVLGQDYVRTARAKGLQERVLLGRHALRNAMVPVVTLVGSQFAFLIGGAVVIETLFSIPGVGQMVFTGIRQRDFALVQGTLVCVGALLVTVNLLLDVTYGLLDPRVRIR